VVGAPTWSYGDGTAATGETTHVYAQAGTYTVTVTQTDALGNVGSATGSIAVAPPPPPPPPPALGLSSAAFAVTWRASASLGRLVLRGTADEAAQVSGALTRGKFRKPLSFRVPAGPWVVRIALPRTLVPGPYRVLLTGQAAGRPTAPAAGSARLKAPREGVVDDYVISSSRRGPDGASFTRARKLYLRFHFASLPRAGARIRLHIAGPRKLQDVKVLNRRVTIGTDIGNTGRLLPKGRWHFVLRADGRVVKRASVLLR
jgi:hypothetical protein